METVASRIKTRRKELKLTQTTLGKKIGVSGGSISQWEAGINEPKGDNLFSLAKVFGCDPAWILYGKNDMVNIEPARMGGNLIPMISYIQAGNWSAGQDISAIDGGIEYIQTDLELSNSAFSLKIKGRSMEPEFTEGDIIIVDPEVTPNPGDYVVAKNGKDEATFKKYKPRGLINGVESFELVPLNDDFPTLRSNEQEVRIIGTMVEHRRYRRPR